MRSSDLSPVKQLDLAIMAVEVFMFMQMSSADTFAVQGQSVAVLFFIFSLHFNVIISHLFQFEIIDIPNFYQILVKK